MLVPSPEKSAAMKEFDAKRAQVAYINAKVAALDDEQLTLQQHLLNFEADRAALKQKFEDEVPKLRQAQQLLEEQRAILVELGIKLTAPTNNDDEDIRNSWEQKSKEQEHRIASWVLELKDVAKKRKALVEEKQALLGINKDDGSVDGGAKVGTSIDDETCSSYESDDPCDLQIELNTANYELNESKIRIANTQLELDDTKAKLEKALIEHTTEKTALNKTINILTNELNTQSRLTSLLIKIRLRFFESSKRRLSSSGIVKVRGEPDRAIIDEGNRAVHGGNVIVDTIILSNHPGLGKQYDKLFEEIYGKSYKSVYEERSGMFATSKVVEIMNLRGTMAHCLSFTKLSHDEDQDTVFLGLLDKCKNIYNELRKSGKSTSEVIQAFNEDQEVEGYCVIMRRICAGTVDAEKARLRS